MTIAKTASRVQYSGNGSTVDFAYSYRFFDDTDINVYLLDTDGVETLQTLTTHYSVSNNGDETGGTITMVTAPASGETLTILSDIPQTQSTDYQANDAFPAETHEAALDRLTRIDQQVSEKVDRALVAPASDSSSVELPYDRASTFLYFDASKNPTAVASVTETPVTTFMETLLDDEDAETARTTLSAQEQGDVLDDLNTLGANASDGEFLVGTGAGAFAWEKLSTAVASLGLNNGPFYAAHGGTANAATLTTGIELSSLSAGLVFVAKFSVTNTGAMTVAIDGLTAVDVKTVTNENTPAGYIRTDVPTWIWFDGTDAIAFRELESGGTVGSGGRWTKYANGRIEMEELLDNFASGSEAWTLPVTLASSATATAQATSNNAANPRIISTQFDSTSQITAYQWDEAGSTANANAHVFVVGEWY